MTRILGVDPGSAATGWALVSAEGRRFRADAYGVIRPGNGDRTVRLARLEDEFARVVERQRPDAAAVESGFSGKNPRSGLRLAESRGVLLAVLGRFGIPTRSHTPAEVKTAVVGYGRAEKEQIVFMVTRLLDLEKRPAADAADAMAVALASLRTVRWNGRVSLVDREK